MPIFHSEHVGLGGPSSNEIKNKRVARSWQYLTTLNINAPRKTSDKAHETHENIARFYIWRGWAGGGIADVLAQRMKLIFYQWGQNTFPGHICLSRSSFLLFPLNLFFLSEMLAGSLR